MATKSRWTLRQAHMKINVDFLPSSPQLIRKTSPVENSQNFLPCIIKLSPSIKSALPSGICADIVHPLVDPGRISHQGEEKQIWISQFSKRKQKMAKTKVWFYDKSCVFTWESYIWRFRREKNIDFLLKKNLNILGAILININLRVIYKDTFLH